MPGRRKSTITIKSTAKWQYDTHAGRAPNKAKLANRAKTAKVNHSPVRRRQIVRANAV